MNDRDRFPSYLREALDHVEHYINYRGRTVEDLEAINEALCDLQGLILTRPIYPPKKIKKVN